MTAKQKAERSKKLTAYNAALTKIMAERGCTRKQAKEFYRANGANGQAHPHETEETTADVARIVERRLNVLTAKREQLADEIEVVEGEIKKFTILEKALNSE